MKTLIKLVIIFLVLAGCRNENTQPQTQTHQLYLYETADYYDLDTAGKVVYLKSHQQLTERGLPGEEGKVLNALGHNVSLDYSSPKIIVSGSKEYDITIHQHIPGENKITISSAVELIDLKLVRYYMPEILRIDSIRSVFQFLDPLEMTESIEADSGWTGIYTMTLKNTDSIDWEGGERVILEYEDYKIPIPWQIFEE